MTLVQQSAFEDIIASLSACEARGDYIGAARFCRKAIFLDPKNISLIAWLGWIYFKIKDYSRTIECADAIKDTDVSQYVPGRRLLIFACAASGQWSRAALAFVELENTSHDDCVAIAHEAASTFLATLRNKYKEGDYKSTIDLYFSLPKSISKLNIGYRHEMALISTAACLRVKKYKTSIQTLAPIDSSDFNIIEKFEENGLLSGVTLITSIMPGRISIQKRAIQSWLEYGANVLSINAPDEAIALRKLYSNVKFVETKRDARSDFGKPYIYMHDMITALGNERSPVVGVINSDIVLHCRNWNIISEIFKEAHNSIVYGHRYNLKNIDDTEINPEEGRIFEYGYDWFVFPKRFVAALAKQPFVFGCPWWDLWLPLLALHNTIDIVLVRDPFAYHETHDQNWSDSTFLNFGLLVVSEIERFGESDSDSIASRKIAEIVSRCKAGIQNNTDPEVFLEWFAEFLRNLTSSESRYLEN